MRREELKTMRDKKVRLSYRVAGDNEDTNVRGTLTYEGDGYFFLQMGQAEYYFEAKQVKTCKLLPAFAADDVTLVDLE